MNRIKGIAIIIAALFRYFRLTVKHMSVWERPINPFNDEAVSSARDRMENGLYRYEVDAIHRAECRGAILLFCGREPTEEKHQEYLKHVAELKDQERV